MISVTFSDFVKNQDVQICIIKQRYGGKLIGFVGYEASVTCEIVECFGGADHYEGAVTNYFSKADWFPLTYGDTAEEVFEKLTAKVDKAIEEVGEFKYRLAIDQATTTFASFGDEAYKPLNPSLTSYLESFHGL